MKDMDPKDQALCELLEMLKSELGPSMLKGELGIPPKKDVPEEVKGVEISEVKVLSPEEAKKALMGESTNEEEPSKEDEDETALLERFIEKLRNNLE